MSRIGINLADARHFSPAEMIEMAQAAERAGFESLYLGETWGWDIGMLLGVFATQTSRIRLGGNVQNIFARTPSALAQSAVTLDILSGGRAIIGLGIATPAVVQDWHGIPFDRPVQRLRETIAILRQALSGQRLDFRGEVFQVQRFKLTVPPIQERIPIVLGTNRRRNVELAGALADAWSSAFAPIQTLAPMREALAEGARSAGRDPAEVEVMPLIRSLVTDDPEPARRLLRRDLAYYFGSQGSLHVRTFTQAGAFLDDLARIKEAWARDPHAAERAVPEEMVDATAIVGTPAECRTRLDRWRAAGADVPILLPVVGTSKEDTFRMIEALGTRKQGVGNRE